MFLSVKQKVKESAVAQQTLMTVLYKVEYLFLQINRCILLDYML